MKMSLKNTVAYATLVMSFALFSTQSFSSDEDQLDIIIKTGSLNPTSKQVRGAVIRALIHYNWKIQTVNNNQITALYRKRIGLDIIFVDNSSVEIVMKPAGSRRWLPRINQFVLKDLKYHYFMRKL